MHELVRLSYSAFILLYSAKGTKMNVNYDAIRAIAEAFKLEPSPIEWLSGWYYTINGHPGDIRIADGVGDKAWDVDLICFAAYAKAEMAKRGWTPFAEGTTVGYSIQFFDEYGEQANGDGKTTACHDYDPRDPIAEANATMLAIAEALTLSPNANIRGA
jgi:hypothetical protein